MKNSIIKQNIMAALLINLVVAQAAQATVETVTSPNRLQEIINNGRPTLVRTEAEWCGPCKETKSAFAAESNKYSNVDFVVVDADKHGECVPDVTGLPTIEYYDNAGQKVHTQMGASQDDRVENYKKTMHQNMKKVSNQQLGSSIDAEDSVAAVSQEAPAAAAPAQAANAAASAAQAASAVAQDASSLATAASQEASTMATSAKEAAQVAANTMPAAKETAAGIFDHITTFISAIFMGIKNFIVGIFDWIKGLFGK